MRIDLYTKVVLTAIAVLLGVIALRGYAGPEVVQAQGAFSGVQYNNEVLFDTRTGDLWIYSGQKLDRHWRMTKLGQPWVDVK